MRAPEKLFVVLFKPITYMFPTALSVPTSTVAMACMNKTLSAVSGSGAVEMVYNKEIHQAAGKA